MKCEDLDTTWDSEPGRICAYYLTSPLRTLSEKLLLGDIGKPFMDAVEMELHHGAILLDIGSGSGHFALKVSEFLSDGKLICVDLSDSMFDRLNELILKHSKENILFPLKCPASTLSIANQSIDLVFSNALLHELKNPQQTLDETFRVLKDGGSCIFTDFTDTWLGKILAHPHQKDDYGAISTTKLLSMMEVSGFKNIEVLKLKHWVFGKGYKL